MDSTENKYLMSSTKHSDNPYLATNNTEENENGDRRKFSNLNSRELCKIFNKKHQETSVN